MSAKVKRYTSSQRRVVPRVDYEGIMGWVFPKSIQRQKAGGKVLAVAAALAEAMCRKSPITKRTKSRKGKKHRNNLTA